MTGFLPVYKVENTTSFKVVSQIRKLTNEKKCGHTGTLDPMATGVLPVAVGGATRFIELLPDHTKSYEATFKTGAVTDTLDIWGTVTKEYNKTAKYGDILSVLPEFTGKIKQLPPMYSAVKKDGVRLYEIARKGETAEREERECEIFSLSVTEKSENNFSLSVKCSSGTYIRTLINDIGEVLGTGAVMTSLLRTSACNIPLSKCKSADELFGMKENGTLAEAFISVEELMKAYPSVNVTPAQGKRFLNGGELSKDRFYTGNITGLTRVYSEKKFLGMGEILDGNENMTVKRIYSEV